MRDASIRQLQIFEAAARHQSFARASAELHLTQPAVSMQMKQLEHFAGLPLFERAGRGIRLTEAGALMQSHARNVLRALQETEEAFAALRGLETGRVSIGAVSTAKYFTPRLLAGFHALHPRVELRLSVVNRDALVQQLGAHEVDVAIMGTPPPGLDAVCQPFAPHPLVIVAHPDHPLASRRRVPLQLLAGETFLVCELGSGTRAAMERFFRRARLAVEIGTELSSNETIKQAVRAGMGLAFISRHTVGLELSARRLVVLPVPGTPVERRWNVVHRRVRKLSPSADAFRAFVEREGARIIAQWT